MDGSSKSIIQSDKMHWPNGLAIDYLTKKVYFTDGRAKAIYRINMNGSEFTTIKSDLQHPHDITVHGKLIFWTDWQAYAIQSCYKTTGKENHKILLGSMTPLAIKSLASRHQPKG